MTEKTRPLINGNDLSRLFEEVTQTMEADGDKSMKEWYKARFEFEGFSALVRASTKAFRHAVASNAASQMFSGASDPGEAIDEAIKTSLISMFRLGWESRDQLGGPVEPMPHDG